MLESSQQSQSASFFPSIWPQQIIPVELRKEEKHNDDYRIRFNSCNVFLFIWASKLGQMFMYNNFNVYRIDNYSNLYRRQYGAPKYKLQLPVVKRDFAQPVIQVGPSDMFGFFTQ